MVVAEVLLDQETHAEIQEHRSPSTGPTYMHWRSYTRSYTRSRPMNSGRLICLGLGFDKIAEPKDE